MRMKIRYLGSIFLGFLIVCGAVEADTKLNVEDGTWEVTSQVKMQGMTMAPMTFSQCITQSDAVPHGDVTGQENCKVSDVETVGNTVTWTLTCRGQGGSMQGKGRITYSGTSFEGEVTTETMGMVMVTQMTGQRTGPCR
jgi:hypothetical protein